MDFKYVNSTDDWAIGQQGLMLVEDGIVYSIYKKYEKEGWTPFKLIGSSLKECFVWFRIKNIISNDEMEYQISLINKD